MNEMQIDSLIETIDVHCFRRGIAVEQFVDTIQEISALLDSLEIPVNELPQFIAKEKEELEILKQVARDTKSKTGKLLQSVDVTLDILVEYDRNKGKLQNYETMEKKVNDIQQLLNYYNTPGKVFLDISKEQLKSTNMFFINSVTRMVSVRCCNTCVTIQLGLLTHLVLCKNKHWGYLVTRSIMNLLPKMKTKKKDFNYVTFMI